MGHPLQLSYSPILGHSSIFERVWPLNLARSNEPTCAHVFSRATFKRRPTGNHARILRAQSTRATVPCPRRSYSAAPSRPIVAAVASSPARGQRVHWTLAFRLPRAASATSPAHSASSPSTEQSVQHSHSIPPLARRVYSLLSVSSESQETPPPLPSLARELLSGELSRHRPPPPEAAPGAPSRRHKATRVSSLRTRRFTDLPIFLPTRHRRPRGLHRATPCHPQRTPSTDRGAPPVNVYVDEPPLRKTPRLPLLFPRSLG